MKITFSRRLSFALVALFLWGAQLACQANVDPKDQRLQPPITAMNEDFQCLMQQLRVLPFKLAPSPRITHPDVPPEMGGQLTVGGYGDTPASIARCKGLSEPRRSIDAAAPPSRVRLYRLQPAGCVDGFTPQSILAETEVRADGTWEVVVNAPGAALLAATQVTQDGESGLSNLLAIAPTRLMPAIQNLEQRQKQTFIARQDFATIPLDGSAAAGFCLKLIEKTPVAVLLKQAEVQSKGSWSMADVRLPVGQHQVELVVAGLETQIPAVEFVLQVAPLKLEWPFGSVQNGSYVPEIKKGTITSWYGRNDCHWGHKCGCPANVSYHNGLDIAIGQGVEIHPVAVGVVYNSSPTSNGTQRIKIDHGDWASVYYHMQKVFVKPGQSVSPATVIGTVGNTGTGTGYHLHVSAFVWRGGSRQDPSRQCERDKNNRILDICGPVINLNPPPCMTLAGNHTSAEFGEDQGIANYWNISDWSQVKVDWTAGGTSFCLFTGKCTFPKSCQVVMPPAMSVPACPQ